MSAYETRDSIRDSRAALLAEHKATLAELAAERAAHAETKRQFDAAMQAHNRKPLTWWQNIVASLPRRAK